jgi:FAD/FMN-containing dehydrogenase
MINPGPDGYYHPATEADLVALIEKANSARITLRVRGSGHSEPGGINASAQGPGRGDAIDVQLDRMAAVTFDDESMQVTVQAGCHLGRDPEDLTGTSTWSNSLFWQLDRHGWALPDMGGITRQTVGGFLSTGSAGGSVEHSPGDLIVKIRLVDGNGVVHEWERSDDPNNPFFAAGISMGLLGVITSVTLQCVPKYNVIGHEQTSDYESCAVDLFGAGGSRPSLETFLRAAEHSRLLWWPQKGARKMTVWQASKIRATPDFVPKPYQQVRPIFGSTTPAYAAIALAFKLLDGLNPPGPRGLLEKRFERVLSLAYKVIAGQLLRPTSQDFQDFWWRGLPMDDQTNYRHLPTSFTELWVPIDKTEEAMNRLRRHFEEGGYPATGIYACELYASSPSQFWMSPAYGQAMFRIDPFWPRKSGVDPHRHFYPQFWKLFEDMEYTLHWGKALVPDPEYLSRRYVRWEDFFRLRAEMDPNQVFINDYWRQHLGIAS